MAQAVASWLFTADELAGVLNVSRSTVYRYEEEGKLPAPVRLGGAVRWRAAEIRDWIRAGCPPRAHWEWNEGAAR